MTATSIAPTAPKPRSNAKHTGLLAMAGILLASAPALASFVPTPGPGPSFDSPVVADTDRQRGQASNAGEAGALSGSWSYASGDAGRERISSAIDEAIEDMGLGQDIAKNRLEEELEPAARIVLEVEGATVSLKLGDMAIDDAKIGEWVKWSHDGKDFDVRFKRSGEDLIQQVRSENSSIRRRFKRKDDRLVVYFRLSNERIPNDVNYWLAYN